MFSQQAAVNPRHPRQSTSTAQRKLPAVFALCGLENSKWEPGQGLPDPVVKRILIHDKKDEHRRDFCDLINREHLVETFSSGQDNRLMDIIRKDFEFRVTATQPLSRGTLKTVNLNDDTDVRAMFLRAITKTKLVSVDCQVADSTRMEYGRLLFTSHDANMEDFIQRRFGLHLSQLMWTPGEAHGGVTNITTLGNAVASWLQWLQDDMAFSPGSIQIAMSAGKNDVYSYYIPPEFFIFFQYLQKVNSFK